MGEYLFFTVQRENKTVRFSSPKVITYLPILCYFIDFVKTKSLLLFLFMKSSYTVYLSRLTSQWASA